MLLFVYNLFLKYLIILYVEKLLTKKSSFVVISNKLVYVAMEKIKQYFVFYFIFKKLFINKFKNVFSFPGASCSGERRRRQGFSFFFGKIRR